MTNAEHSEVPHLIILGAGPQQEKLYRIAKQAGHRLIGIDFNTESIAAPLCDIFLPISIKDSHEIIRQLRDLGVGFSGVVTCGAEVSPQVAEIAEAFNLIGIPYEVAMDTTDKFRRSKVLQANGIPIPMFQICSSGHEIDLELPVVVKPIDSSGSRGVTLVRDRTMLQDAVLVAKQFSKSEFVLCEEFINDGVEVSIEAFVLNGTVYVTGVAERHFLDIEDTAPDFVEYGGTMPPTFSAKLVDECKRVFTDAIKALNIVGGPSKGDLIIQNGKVYVLEITSRTSPGFAAEMQPLNSGIEPLKVLLNWATGRGVNPSDLLPKYDRGVAHRYFLHNPGRVAEVVGLELLDTDPEVKYALMLSRPNVGDALGKISYMNRLFYIITDAETNVEAISKADLILDRIKVRTEV